MKAVCVLLLLVCVATAQKYKHRESTYFQDTKAGDALPLYQSQEDIKYEDEIPEEFIQQLQESEYTFQPDETEFPFTEFPGEQLEQFQQDQLPEEYLSDEKHRQDVETLQFEEFKPTSFQFQQTKEQIPIVEELHLQQQQAEPVQEVQEVQQPIQQAQQPVQQQIEKPQQEQFQMQQQMQPLVPCGKEMCSGGDRCCNDFAFSGRPVCYNPFTHKCIDEHVLCGINDEYCNDTLITGMPLCYDPSLYKCIRGIALCHVDEDLCGNACFRPSDATTCIDGRLVALAELDGKKEVEAGQIVAPEKEAKKQKRSTWFESLFEMFD